MTITERTIIRGSTAEKTITAAELDARFAEVLGEIRRDDVVYIVDTGNREVDYVPSGLVSERGTISFVLGPPHRCGPGLVYDDPEYGWPAMIDVSEVRGSRDLAPGYHRHPIIVRGDTVLAVSVMIGEYEQIKARHPA